MEIVDKDGNVATVRLTTVEMAILANTINETREAIEDWEFSSRVGAEWAEVDALRQKLKALLASMKEPCP